MKPRLKLTASGCLILLSTGTSGLNEDQTRKLIRRNYGSVKGFAGRFGLQYDAACYALHPNAVHCTGRLGRMRQLLGLTSVLTTQTQGAHL